MSLFSVILVVSLTSRLHFTRSEFHEKREHIIINLKNPVHGKQLMIHQMKYAKKQPYLSSVNICQNSSNQLHAENDCYHDKELEIKRNKFMNGIMFDYDYDDICSLFCFV